MSQPYQQASTLYEKEQYDAALEILQKNPHPHHSSYFYNLAIIYWAKQEPLLAKIYLQKASLDSTAPYIQKAIEQFSLMESPLLNKSYILAKRLQSAESSALFYFLLSVSGLLWIRSYHKRSSLNLSFLYTGSGIAAWLSGILAFIILMTRFSFIFKPICICIEPTFLHSGPGESYYKVIPLETGQKVTALSQKAVSEVNEEWRQVIFNQQIGWLKTTTVLEM